MVDYAKSKATATSLLTKFGQSVVLRNVTIGTYDPATGANAVTSSDTSVKAAVFDFGRGQTEMQGNLVQTGDKRCIMSATATPSLEDKVVVGGKEYAIIGIGEVNPAGTRVISTLHLRA